MSIRSHWLVVMSSSLSVVLIWGQFCPSVDSWQCLETLLDVQLVESYWHLVGRIFLLSAAKHLAMHRTGLFPITTPSLPTTKNYLAQNVNRAKAEKPHSLLIFSLVLLITEREVLIAPTLIIYLPISSFNVIIFCFICIKALLLSTSFSILLV